MDKTENKCATTLMRGAQHIYEQIAAQNPLPLPAWHDALDEDVVRCIEAAIASGRAARELSATAHMLEDERRAVAS